MTIGLDIGGSFIKAIVFEKDGVRGEEIKTPKNLATFKKEIAQLLLVVSSQRPINSLGVAVAGTTDRGQVLQSPNIKYLSGFKLAAWLKHFAKNIKIDNDARSFLRAELVFGAAAEQANVLGLTVGTGLGGALSKNGKLLPYPKHTHLEIGHLKIGQTEAEHLASLKFLKKHPRDFGGLANNLAAIIRFQTQKNRLDCVVLGGSLFTDKKTAQAVLIPLQKKIEQPLIRLANLGPFSGAIGATLLFR